MSKLKIEHGINRVKRAKLQTYIDQTVADDISLMTDATNNEPHYIVTCASRSEAVQQIG